jgi:hypothetical protein
MNRFKGALAVEPAKLSVFFCKIFLLKINILQTKDDPYHYLSKFYMIVYNSFPNDMVTRNSIVYFLWIKTSAD